MNSVSLSFGQGSKSSYSNESFLLLSNMFRKNEKEITAKRNLTVCASPETEYHINSFHSSRCSLFMSSENIWKPLFFDIFRWLEREYWPEMVKPWMNFHT